MLGKVKIMTSAQKAAQMVTARWKGNTADPLKVIGGSKGLSHQQQRDLLPLVKLT